MSAQSDKRGLTLSWRAQWIIFTLVLLAIPFAGALAYFWASGQLSEDPKPAPSTSISQFTRADADQCRNKPSHWLILTREGEAWKTAGARTGANYVQEVGKPSDALAYERGTVVEKQRPKLVGVTITRSDGKLQFYKMPSPAIPPVQDPVSGLPVKQAVYCAS